MRNESLNREKFAYDYEKDSGGIRLTPEGDRPIDWLNMDTSKITGQSDYSTMIERSNRIGNVDQTKDPWKDSTPQEKADFIRWKEQTDRGVPAALFHSPEGSLIGKSLEAVGLTEPHPSGYRFQPKGIAENITYGLGGIMTDMPVFKAGGAIGSVMGKAIPGAGRVANTAREMLTSGMQFAPHSAGISAVDDINAGKPVDWLKAGREGLVSGALGAGLPLVTKAVEKVAGAAAKSVYQSNIDKAIKRGAFDRGKVIDSALGKALNTEKLVNKVKLPVEAGYFTAAGTALHDQPFTVENYIINLGTFAALKALKGSERSSKTLDKVSKETGLSPEKIAEQIPLNTKELKDVLRNPEKAEALVNDAAKKAQEVKKDNDLIKAYDPLTNQKILIPTGKNVPDALAPVEGEPYYSKSEKQMLREIAKINPEGVKAYDEIKKSNYSSQPEIKDKLDQAFQTMMSSIDTFQDPARIYKDFGILDTGSIENPYYQNLKPRYQQEVLRRVKSELTRRYDENYHDVVARLNKVEAEIHRDIKNEYNSYDNPPDWGLYSKAEYDRKIKEKVEVEKVKNEKQKADNDKLIELQIQKDLLATSDKNIFEKKTEWDRLSEEERKYRGADTASAKDIIDSIKNDKDFQKVVADVGEGRAPASMLVRSARAAVRSVMTGEARYIARYSKYGKLLEKTIKDYRELADQFNEGRDHELIAKQYDKETLNNAHRLNDLTPERYAATVGTPSELVVRAAQDIHTVNKRMIDKLKGAGAEIEELDSYYKHRIKPEYLENGKREMEFLEWMGEELNRMYPDRETPFVADPELRKKQAIEKALNHREKQRTESLVGDKERKATLQLNRVFENMPEQFYMTDKPFEVMQQYYMDAQERYARAKVFGARDENLRQILNGLKLEVLNKYDKAMADNLIEKTVRLIDTVSHRTKPVDLETHQVVAMLSNWQVLQKMSLSQIGQIPQFFEPMIQWGIKPHLQAMKAMSGLSKELPREQAIDMATRATKAIRAGQQAVLNDAMELSNFGQKFLSKTKFTKMDSVNRMQGAVTGIFVGEMLMDKLNRFTPKVQNLANELLEKGSWKKFNESISGKGITLSPAEKISMNRARLVIDRINRLNIGLNEVPRNSDGKYYLSDEMRTKIIRNTEEMSNFRGNYEGLPEIFNSEKAWMKLITQFKKFTFEKTKHTLNDVVLREMKLGNPLPLLRLVAIGIPTGVPTTVLRNVISGRALPKGPGDFAMKAAAAAAVLGTFEIPLSMLKNQDLGLIGAQFGDILGLGQSIGRAMKKDSIEDAGLSLLGSFAKYMVPVYGNTINNAANGREVFGAVKKIAEGENPLWEEPKITGAKTYSDYIRQAKKKYSDSPARKRIKEYEKKYR